MNHTSLFLYIAEDAAGEHHEKIGLFEDPAIWVSLGFIIVMLLFWRMGVHQKVGAQLDQRKEKIANDLDEARRLREEAQEVLAQYQRRQREAEEEASDIIDQAKRDAERLAKEAREKINDQLARRSKAAEEKIARAEAQALTAVRQQATDISVEAARNIIRERMDTGAQNALIERAIGDLRSKLN